MEDLDFKLIKPGALLGESDHAYTYKCKYNNNYICSYKSFKAERVSLNAIKQCSALINSELKRVKNHFNVEQFIGTCFDDMNQFYLVTEFVVGKTLSEFLLADVKNVSFERKGKICFQLSQGLEFLHNSNFVHRNLMSQSVILDYENNYSPKITDVALYEIQDAIDFSNKIKRSRKDLYWKAPELMDLVFSSGSKKADTFGFGIMLWEIVAETNAKNYMEQLLAGNYGDKLSSLPDDFITVMKASLSISPEYRPSCQELTIGLHPFAGADDDELSDDEVSTSHHPSTILSMRESVAPINDGEMNSLFERGKGFLQSGDYVQAAKCFDIPAWNGHNESQYSLGRLYLFGLGREHSLLLATKWLEKASNNNHVEAEYLLASMFYHGFRESGRVDKDEAAYIFQKLTKKNHFEAKLFLAYCYETGNGFDVKPERAFKLYEKCAEEGNLTAIYRLGKMYVSGFGCDQDRGKAKKLFEQGIEKGSMRCLFELGRLYEQGKGVDKNLEEAFECYRLAGEANISEACFHLAIMYERGLGTEINPELCFHYFHKAGTLNYFKAFRSLGHKYDKGAGVKRDCFQAVFWYKKSAIGGNGFSQNNLARCYQLGSGVEKDTVKAVQWYRKSCAQGVTQAMVNLGRCFEQGVGVEKDFFEAFSLYKQAADKNDQHGLYKMGTCYEEGIGTEASIDMATRFYEAAKAEGSDKAELRLNQINKPIPVNDVIYNAELPPLPPMANNRAITHINNNNLSFANKPLPLPSSKPLPLPSPKPSSSTRPTASRENSNSKPPTPPKENIKPPTPPQQKPTPKLEFLSLEDLYSSKPSKKATPKPKVEESMLESSSASIKSSKSATQSLKQRFAKLGNQRFNSKSPESKSKTPNLTQPNLSPPSSPAFSK